MVFSEVIVNKLLQKMQYEENLQKETDLVNALLYLNELKQFSFKPKHRPENTLEEDIAFTLSVKTTDKNEKHEAYYANFKRNNQLINETLVERNADYKIKYSGSFLESKGFTEEDKEKLSFLDYFNKIFEDKAPKFEFKTEKEIEFKQELLNNFYYLLEKDIIFRKKENGYSFSKIETMKENGEKIEVECLIYQEPRSYLSIREVLSNFKEKNERIKVG